MKATIYPSYTDILRPITIATLKRYSDNNRFRTSKNNAFSSEIDLPSNDFNLKKQELNPFNNIKLTFASGTAVVNGQLIYKNTETTVTIPIPIDTQDLIVQIRIPTDENGIPKEILREDIEQYIEYTNSKDKDDNAVTIARFNPSTGEFVQNNLNNPAPVEKTPIPRHSHRLSDYLRIENNTDPKTLHTKKVSFQINGNSTKRVRLSAKPEKFGQENILPTVRSETEYSVVARPVENTPVKDVSHSSFIDESEEDFILKVTNTSDTSVDVTFSVLIVQVNNPQESDFFL